MIRTIKNEFTDDYITLTNEEFVSIAEYIKKEERLAFARQYLRGIKYHCTDYKCRNMIESILCVEALLEKFAKQFETDILSRMRTGKGLDTSTLATFMLETKMNKYRCISNKGTASEIVNIVRMPSEMAHEIILNLTGRLSVELFDVNGEIIDTEFIDEIVRM